DAWTPLRAERRYSAPRPERRPRRFSRQRSAAITATQGRWSLTAPLFPGKPDRRALAELLLERQGIVTRDGVRAEGIPGGYAALFVERGGRSLLPLREPDQDWLRPALERLDGHARRSGMKRLAVERFDGKPITETGVMTLLVEAGFLAGPRRAVLRP